MTWGREERGGGWKVGFCLPPGYWEMTGACAPCINRVRSLGAGRDWGVSLLIMIRKLGTALVVVGWILSYDKTGFCL